MHLGQFAAAGVGTVFTGPVAMEPPDDAEQILVAGRADMIALGRALINNPHGRGPLREPWVANYS